MPSGHRTTGVQIRDGKATLVVYDIWRGANGEEGEIDWMLPLSEFGF